MKELRQNSITDPKEIFGKLKSLIINSEMNIKVVSAWFTDPELLDLLIEKQKTGIQIELIIADNKENKKLQFDDLIKAGGMLIRVPKKGFGIMHHKFCIIDDEILVLGTYNWTVNARKNNEESVIVTNHERTRIEMVALFDKLKNAPKNRNHSKSSFFKGVWRKITKGMAKEKEVDVENIPADTVPENLISLSNQELSYKAIFDNILTQEIAFFDQNKLRKYGFDRSEANDGDAMMIANSLDVVYSDFQKDTLVGEDKLNELVSKIKLEKQSIQSQLERRKTQSTNSLEQLYASLLNKRILNLERLCAEIETKKVLLASVEEKKDQKIGKIDEIKEKISELKRSFIPARAKMYEWIVFGFFATGLLTYLFFFYTSAGYIMLYSADDALLAVRLGDFITSPDVYDHEALFNAKEKGPGAIGMLICFFCIPLALAVTIIYQRDRTSRYNAAQVFSLLGILLLDAFMAMKVSVSIFEVQYLMGEVDGEWNIYDLLTDSNFYLVFFLGTLPLLVFELVGAKLKKLFDMNHGNQETFEFENQKNYLLDGLKTEEFSLEELNQEMIGLSSELIQLNSNHSFEQRNIDNLPIEKERELSSINENYLSQNSEVENYANAVHIKIENGQLPYSLENMKERISLFLEGWGDYLHNKFSNKVAIEFSESARNQKEEWLMNKTTGLIISKAA